MGGKFVEGFAGVPGVDHPREDGAGFGRRLRQLDVVAQACVRKTPGLEMTGEGEHRLRKFEVSLRQRIRGKPCEIRRAIIAGIETIGFGLLKAGNHGLGACFSMPLSSHNGGERIGCRSLLGYGRRGGWRCGVDV